VWTTFSPDQVDLNFKSERVLTAIIEVLLLYVRRGADIVRLDAVTFIWRELGTTCAHLEQGHALVKLFRAILDVVAPHVALITETNVPHEDNISYFGDGYDEAQMVYNFALPPLVLHAFHRGDSTASRAGPRRCGPRRRRRPSSTSRRRTTASACSARAASCRPRRSTSSCGSASTTGASSRTGMRAAAPRRPTS
jgi:hypothetical protein